MHRRLSTLPLIVLSACFSITEVDDTSSGSTSTTEASSGSSGLLDPTRPPATSGGSSTSGGADGSSDQSSSAPPSETSDGNCNFLGCGEDTPPVTECDFWDDDCPRGEKCTFWANDGGNSWNATRCVPLDPDPAGPGEPCTTKNPVSGLDDCDTGSMCWNVDAAGEGTCMPFCVGSPEAPTCEDAARSCHISGGPLALCIPSCDPLLETCPAGQGCYPSGSPFSCAPDASGDGGGVFASCEFTNACDPGLLCAQAGAVGLCEAGSAHCCTPYCDLTAPSCPEGTSCIPYFPEQAEAGYEDVGVCGQQ